VVVVSEAEARVLQLPRSSKVAIITSARAKSLQKVGYQIAEVLEFNGLRTKMVFDSIPPQDLVTLVNEVDAGLVVMPVDLSFCSTFMYDCYRLKSSGKKAFYYGTIEGEVKNPRSLSWVRDRIDFIANSRYTKKKLENAGFRVVDLVYHGVPVNDYLTAPVIGSKFRSWLGVGGNTFLVGYLASGLPRKGHDLASEVARIVGKKDSSIKFLIISAPEAAQYYSDLDNVIFLDKFASVDEDFIKGFYGALDLYAQFSLSEGFGMPVLEALACGRLVAHADYEPLSEITTEKTSFRVPVRAIKHYSDYTSILFELHIYDPSEFADVIIQAKDVITKTGKEELAVIARERAKEFDMFKVYHKFVEILR
jgi:glycosyltransferase involved in cell wall biosynthesis